METLIQWYMFHNAHRILKTTVVLLAAVVTSTYGQATFIGARFTGNSYPSAHVENPSPSHIYGSKHSSIETGIYALRFFKGEQFGIKAGLEFGLIPWDVGVIGPRNAFGTGTGNGEINTAYSIDDFSYKAFTASFAYKVPIKRSHIEIIAGASVRDYAFGNGDDGIGFGLNRSTLYNPDDPAHGPPDVNVIIKSLDDQFHLSFPISIDYVFKTSRRTQLKLGIMRNIAVKPISDSELTVVMYQQTYKGKFNILTGFWGVNVHFDYELKRKRL